MTEEFKVSGKDITNKIKDLIKEGNIRKITIKNNEEKVIAEFPLTVGVVGTVLVPVVAAIGTIVALAADCTISVEKTQEEAEETEKTTEDEIVEEEE